MMGQSRRRTSAYGTKRPKRVSVASSPNVATKTRKDERRKIRLL
jgi:hypothetical protein